MTWQDFVKQYAFVFTLTGAFLIFLLTQWLTVRRAHKEFCYKIIRKPVEFVEIIHSEESGFALAATNEAEIVRVVFANIGNQDIDEKDFAPPISICFPNTVEIVEAKVVIAVPERFQPSIDTQDSNIVVKPTLMNRGNQFIIEALVNPFIAPNINGMIKGIYDLTDADKEFRKYVHRKAAVHLAFWIWLIFLATQRLTNYNVNIPIAVSVMIMLTLLGTFLESEYKRKFYQINFVADILDLEDKLADKLI